MHIVSTLMSVALIALVLLDGFEAMVLPRRVTRTYRPARLFYRTAWSLWRTLARLLRTSKRRETFLSYFGPFSLVVLFGLWMLTLLFGFGLLHWSLETALQTPERETNFGTYLYLSGTTIFTLGYGDIVPLGAVGRALAVVEAGLGFGFLAIIIGYLPVLYQAFSNREVPIALLDARASSPPSAAEFLLRVARARSLAAVDPFLALWERWAAELLESHLSFPVLSFYRSQHDNQSWLAALTMVLDTCAVLISAVKDGSPYQAQVTFAAARHAAVDLALLFRTPPLSPEPDRLSPERFQQLRAALAAVGLELREGPTVADKLTQLRGMYEPFVNALAHNFLFTLPPILSDRPVVDNWQSSAWMRRAPSIGTLHTPDPQDEHFD